MRPLLNFRYLAFDTTTKHNESDRVGDRVVKVLIKNLLTSQMCSEVKRKDSSHVSWFSTLKVKVLTAAVTVESHVQRPNLVRARLPSS